MAELEYNREEFQKLLKYGIGARTQKEFAEQVGMATATINRMLNDKNFPCPRQKTVEILAAHVKNIPEASLLASCGYQADSMEDRIQKVESDIEDFFEFSTDSNCVFNSFDEIKDKLGSFISKYNAVLSVRQINTVIPSDMEAKGAEDVYTVHAVWDYNMYKCTTSFNVFCLTTKKEKTILIGSDINRVTDHKHTSAVRYNSHSARDRLLNAIFGTGLNKDGFEGEQIITVKPGYGFEINGTPEGFMDFLMEHADTFCDTKENIALYQKAMLTGNPEEVFKDYTDIGGDCGTSAVISDIMRKETGLGFMFYDVDLSVPEEKRNACVMLPAETSPIINIDSTILNNLYEYAKALKIKNFGAVYYRTSLYITDNMVMNTDTYLTL